MSPKFSVEVLAAIFFKLDCFFSANVDRCAGFFLKWNKKLARNEHDFVTWNEMNLWQELNMIFDEMNIVMIRMNYENQAIRDTSGRKKKH